MAKITFRFRLITDERYYERLSKGYIKKSVPIICCGEGGIQPIKRTDYTDFRKRFITYRSL